MHFCNDELVAIMALVPGVPYLCYKCKQLYRRLRYGKRV